MNNDLPEGYEYVDPKLIPDHELAPECDLKTTPEGKLIARLGTTAMYRTPLPEVRCICGFRQPRGYGSGREHAKDCPAHPRNALVRVLPQLLAGLPGKPEGLLWANIGENDWEPYDIPWPFIIEDEGERGLVAYAIKQHELDAIEAGKEKTPLPAAGEAKDLKTWEAKWSEIIDSWKASDSPPGHLADYVQKLHIITGPNGMCMCGENGITCGERLRQVSHEIADCQLIASFQPKVPSQASGPTDGEKGVFDALLRLYRNDYLPPELAIGDDCPCDHGIMDGVPCKTCDEAAVALYIADQEKKHPLKTDWLE